MKELRAWTRNMTKMDGLIKETLAVAHMSRWIKKKFVCNETPEKNRLVIV